MGALEDLRRRLDDREAVVGIIGLGYVGLPLAATVCEAGFPVVGFDVDPEKIDRLRAGKSYIDHVGDERLSALRPDADTAEALSRGLLASDRFDELSSCDVVVICVPTPLDANREPDLSFVESTAETIGARLRPGQLVVLESTTWPGTTEEVVRPALEKSGLVAGRDFALAFSPEREDPGNAAFTTRSIPKVVGGLTASCTALASAFYGAVLERVVEVSSARVAEASKLLENIFRSVNIALVNELKMLFDRMDIDVWEVIDASATKPFGFMRFTPGPGLGGHCIPIDPFYLTWKARQYDFATRFIELAGEINTAMPYYVVDRVIEALGRQGKPLPGSRVLVLGVAYKKDVADLRESPALKLIELLDGRGAVVSYNDPHVPTLRAHRFRSYDEFALDSVELTPGNLRAADCVLVATDHSAYDWEAILADAPLVVDTRNATRAIAGRGGQIVKA